MEITKTQQPLRKISRIGMWTAIFAHLLLQIMKVKIPIDEFFPEHFRNVIGFNLRYLRNDLPAAGRQD
ncbi:hypothetical protein HYN48_01165 [Flavobacterium magnum]|uniref:Uncharacterized protein n=1 Tax=Flavobacterium magnum TaxID=2162713 RepID=A0A2S0RC60_9FLAO|nr:hypothetical protein [Flavobacterium magnum]AWA28808.1 hypothetical protein HYN48_01165 [Flavobacterium magnum]